MADEPKAPATPRTGGVIKEILAPVTLLTALAIYFGWVRTNAIAEAFGIEQSLLGFGFGDFVLRSVSTVLVVVAVVGVLLLLIAHLAPYARVAVERIVEKDAARAGIEGWCLQALGLVALVIGVPLFARFSSDVSLNAPALVLAGVALYGAGRYISDRAAEHGGERPEGPSAIRTMQNVALIGLAALSMFGIAAVYARSVGNSRAMDIVASLPSAPSVTVFSERDLQLTGVSSDNFAGGAQAESVAFPWVTRDLRLLVVGKDRLFLAAPDWKVGDGEVFVLPFDDSIRVEISR